MEGKRLRAVCAVEEGNGLLPLVKWRGERPLVVGAVEGEWPPAVGAVEDGGTAYWH